MEKMPFIINGTGRQRRSTTETFKVGDDSLDSSQITTVLAKCQLVSEKLVEITI
jgi:hypothetical protein